jgi:aminoglycoside 3-N-acetyltransferase
MERNNLPVITRSKLVLDLKKLGVKTGRTVMLHASVKAIGWIAGGPNVVLQSLLDVLGSKGTLMMYVGWENSPDENWSREKQQAYLKECPPFDPATSQANRHFGILAESLRMWTEASRSNHPEASIVTVGAKARWLTKDHPLHYPYGSNSPLEKLCNVQGSILLLGAPLNTITLLHYAENIAKVSNKRIIHYTVPVLRNGQRVCIEIEDFDTARGIVANTEEYFKTIVDNYFSSGKGLSGKVGAAQSYLFDSADLTKFAVQWLEKKFGTH